MIRGLVAFSLLCVLSTPASALDARKCGKSGSRCEILGQNLANARSISRIQPDGTFFVGTAGNAQTDLIGELISNRDTDTSAIYRYTEARGLRPWIGGKPSQFIMAFDISSRSYVPYQAGINGVEVLGKRPARSTWSRSSPTGTRRRRRCPSRSSRAPATGST